MNTLAKVYVEFKKRSLTTGRVYFSIDWLGKIDVYFVGNYNKTSLSAKLKLYFKLLNEGHDDLTRALHEVIWTEVGRKHVG